MNVHSGYCLIVTGYDPPVWLTGGTACTSAPVSVADWYYNVNADGPITNGHTGWYFGNNVDGTCGLCQEPYSINGRNWRFTKAN